MEKDQCRSVSKKICLEFARDQILRAQRLLERFHLLCDCPELGGEGCHCVTDEEIKKANSRYTNKRPQSEETNGSPSRRLIFHRCDSSTSSTAGVDFRDSPRPPVYDIKRNVFSVVRYRSVEDQAYDGIRNPYVLVINNVNFYKDPQPRNGADHDNDNVDKFVKKAGFRSDSVKKHFDKRKDQMLEILEQTRRNWELVEHDSFICIIMSHGNEDGILGIDSEAIPVEDITAKFQGGNNCPQLATKPKLFFLQACRGDVDDQGYYVPRGLKSKDVYVDSNFEEMPVKLPSEADFLIAYSTTKGYVSQRRFTDNNRIAAMYGARLGSWFISCLVEVLCNNSHHEDLMTMLTKVNKAMSEFYTEGGHKQISCQLSMLTKKVYFENFFRRGPAAV